MKNIIELKKKLWNPYQLRVYKDISLQIVSSPGM